jgi:hypothetical protein
MVEVILRKKKEFVGRFTLAGLKMFWIIQE